MKSVNNFTEKNQEKYYNPLQNLDFLLNLSNKMK